jgi:hypothetical protein
LGNFPIDDGKNFRFALLNISRRIHFQRPIVIFERENFALATAPEALAESNIYSIDD